MVGSKDPPINVEGLRERNIPQHARSDKDAKEVVESLNASENDSKKNEKDQKTFGRTPDGTVFTVPQTHDMVSQLLSPSEPKNISDCVVLAILATHIVTLWLLPASARIPVFASIFLFWRACYNVGIGYLLNIQSHHTRLVRWAEKSKLFKNPSTGENPHPLIYKILKRELETKIPKDYRFEDAPLEYNTWLVFRRIVDLILMCDFVSYCLFAIACGSKPIDETMPMTILRWLGGVGLVAFNLWVKLDAHRVVKDFAWYWGDFFYLIDQDLTFDGVFEMAPHPMYSVGYAGYYGISMMAASYKVLFISIIAHAAQFAFLVLVESPHIEKTYNAPPPRKRLEKHDENSDSAKKHTSTTSVDSTASSVPEQQPWSAHKLLGLQNIDLYRITDSSVLLLQVFLATLTVLTPSTSFHQGLFIANAVAWRLWYSIGIGYLLDRQSNKRKWTRHFLKYGESREEAWRQWKGTYHLSMTMCYASFVAASWKVYSPPADWNHGLVLLKHVLGVSLIALQIWTAVSIYDSLGEFGWFFGDFFFFDHSPKLTYSGIYRFLNNPERIIGLAGVWGVVLITENRAIFLLALLSHVLTLSFIHFVERPHMQKLYGRSLRQDSGLVRSIKRSLPPPLRQWQGNVDKVLGETFDFVDDFLDAARPKLATGVQTFVKDTTNLFNHYPARITITRVAPDVAGYRSKDYSLEIEHPSGKSRSETASQTLTFGYGVPIKVKWTAPLNHSRQDWVAIYKVADNTSREITRVSSQGRWVPTNLGQYDSAREEAGLKSSDVHVSGAKRQDAESEDYLSGEMEFSGDKLFWTQGVFEFRYHHNGKHNVMAISQPFEVKIEKFDEEDVAVDQHGVYKAAVEAALLPLINDCFDRDPEIAPSTVDERFGPMVERDEKYARRAVYAAQQMFGIEFAPEVVRADGTVRNFAWRICEAKKTLVRTFPF